MCIRDRDGNNLSLTLNSSTVTINLNQFTFSDVRIGQRFGGWNFGGIIDDVGIWNRALSDQEIQQLYNNQNYTYNWSPGGENTSSITVQPSVTTTYIVDLTSGNTTCQSDVTVSVNQRDFVTVDSTACDSIQWNGNWLVSTDTYLDTLQNAAGCDSIVTLNLTCLLYTSPSPRDRTRSRMPSSA